MTMGSKMDNLNLAVICHSYNNFQKDPIEIIASSFSSVNVFVRTNPFTKVGKYLPIPQLERFSDIYKIDRTGIPANTRVYLTPIWYIPTDWDYIRLGERHYYHLKSQMKRCVTKFDLVHAHFTWSSGYAGARLKEEFGIPFVVTGHGYDIYSLPFKDDKWREKIEYVLNTADLIITVSKSNLACIKKLDVSSQVIVINNGFRSNLFYPRDPSQCRNELNLPRDKRIILTVGNLESVKGQKYLVEAVKEIVQERKDIICIIIGAGKLHNTLQRQIRNLGLDDYIMLVGKKPHEKIPSWMNACDLFVLPSLNEGNPTVLPEALGCGRPFVGTRVGGVPEVIISEDYGLLVDPADPEDLAEKIMAALDRKWDREKILAYAQRYTWENIAKEIVGVYDQVLNLTTIK